MHARPAADPEFQKMLAGYGLTTARILYRMPDHPSFLQTFQWQFADVAPHYPRLMKFLDHWKREIQAAIHSVEVMHRGLIAPHEIRLASEVGHLH